MKEISLTIKAPNDVRDEEFKEEIAVSLYKNRILSAYQSRLIVGITRREFEELLAKYGVAIADEPDQE